MREANRATARVKMPDMLPTYDKGLSSPAGQMQAGQAVSFGFDIAVADCKEIEASPPNIS